MPNRCISIVAMGLLAVGCCLLVARPVWAQTSPCRAAKLQNNCTACLLDSTADVKCGFCISYLASDFCYPRAAGSIWPADNVLCYGEDMEWHYNSCPDPCLSQGDCEQCRANFGSGCGYCMTTGQCLSSSKKGSCTDWRDKFNDPNACIQQYPCDQTSFCSSCVTNTKYSCKWCGGLEGNCITTSQTCTKNVTVINTKDQCPKDNQYSNSGSATLSSWLTNGVF